MPHPYRDDNNFQDQLKGLLFAKNRELQQIAEEFRKITLLPKEKRQEWVDKNSFFFEELMDAFMQDSMMALDGIEFDSQSKALSVELVSNLRDAMSSLRVIMHDRQTMRS